MFMSILLPLFYLSSFRLQGFNSSVFLYLPATVAERSKACTVFALSEPGSWVPLPHNAWMFGMCMCLFCVCVFLSLGRGLTTSWSLVQGVLPSVKWSWNWKSETRAQAGCRASEKKNYSFIFLLGYTGERKMQNRCYFRELQQVLREQRSMWLRWTTT
jgi:hypothetical protein